MNQYMQNKDFWMNAINTRHSVRSYERRAIENDTMEKLRAYIKNMELPFTTSAELKFFKSREGAQFANNLRNPPEDCIAFIAETDLLSVAEVGFVGELFMLYATGLGLSVCWFGHYISAEINRLLPNFADTSSPAHGYGDRENIGRRVICVSPVGYWETKGLRLLDRLTSKMMSFNRKPIGEKLTSGTTEANLSKEILTALDFARKAPSAANTQHWEFTVDKEQKKIIIAKPVGFKHFRWEHPDVCVGACAAHFWIGLQTQEIPFTMTHEISEDRVLWKFELV
jgi:nitroreductase